MNDMMTHVAETALDRIRSARRHPLRLPVLVRIEADGETVELDCSDISRSGAFLRTDVLFDVGTPLWCEFELPTGHRFGTQATVARIETERSRGACGMGVEFERPCDALPVF